MKIAVTLHFPKGYIANPYWTESEQLITIHKESGLNRARSSGNRAKALKAYLDTKDMTPDDYNALKARAERPFYLAGDVGLAGVPEEEIVIPAHHLHGMTAQGADMAPASIRLARAEQIRTLLTWGDLRTGRTKPDGVWKRFVVVKSGTKQTLSNQRGLRSDPFLAGDLDAWGELRLVNGDTATKARQFISWAGGEIGVGASRKLGWGRFTVTRWEPQP